MASGKRDARACARARWRSSSAAPRREGEPSRRGARCPRHGRRARRPPEPEPAARSRDRRRARGAATRTPRCGADGAEPAEPRADDADPAGAPAPRLQLRHPREHARREPAPHARAQPRRTAAPRRQPSATTRTRGPRAEIGGSPLIRVVGVGGAGVNAVNRMVEAGVAGVEFVAVNTDMQSLQQSDADITLHIGEGLTRGLGAGANPELGRAAAMEDYDRIKHLLKGSDMVFIAAGAGGGTGTGAAPIVARIARGDRRADRRHHHEAVRLRGHAPRGGRAGRHRRARRRGRHADRRPEQPPADACSTSAPRWSRRSASPTTCCARACRASATS